MALLIDGFSTRLEFVGGVACQFTICHKTLTPPELDTGGEIDITTMKGSTKYRMKAPKSLITWGPMSVSAAYDPVVYNEAAINAVLRRLGAVTQLRVIFPTGQGIQFYAFVQKFTFQEIKEGEQPMVDITFTPTLWDGTFTSDGCPKEATPTYFTDGTPVGGFRLCA